MFLAHLVYQPRNLIQSCFVRRASFCVVILGHCPRRRHLCTPLLATELDIETSCDMNMPICPWYMDIKYLVILTCSFQMAAILVLIGSFGLSTKEPCTIMYCPLSLSNHHHHPCTPPPGTGLDIEISYLVYICTYSPTFAHQIFSDSDL